MSELIPSWVETANDPHGAFPLNNLPFGVFSSGDAPRCGVAIGDKVLDLAMLQGTGLLPDCGFQAPSLNAFMGKGKAAWEEVRARLTELLARGKPAERLLCALHDLSDVTLHMPFRVAEYTDFYSSRQHACNVGSLFRDPRNALPPNWLHIPIGYNGRASTIVVSGTDIRRPLGQLKPSPDGNPVFAASRKLDFELEMGAIVGTPSDMGRSVSVDEADELIFGYVLLNDWSARDIQSWEYQPLGPFQAKAFATTISPWIVTKSALEPFRCHTPKRETPLLPYIADTGPMLYDIELSVSMSAREGQPRTISKTNYNTMYYSAAQQLAHHASSGCAMRTGDLLGSGTISGPDSSMFGSLLEISHNGTKPFSLGDDETRTFIEDEDTIALHGEARGVGYRIGFGPCAGRILPAHQSAPG